MDGSIPSQKKERRSTLKIEKLTPEQALEILQQSIIECQKSGIDVQIVPKFFHSGSQYLGIVMANVMFSDGNLVLSDGKQG